MRYDDIIYGTIDIPPEIWNLFKFPEMVRLRGVSQAVLPAECNPYCATPSRFHHGIGVWHLAKNLCKKAEFRHLELDLPLAGLLHDAGDTPFSHLGDSFLRDATGLDGETHLVKILADSELTIALSNLGADVKRICRLVAGKEKPWSELLNGTLDLDNLDHVLRYGVSRGFFDRHYYNPHTIISAIHFDQAANSLYLDAELVVEIHWWKQARRKIYAGGVYAEPHLGLAMMLYRAVEIAYDQGEISGSFWRFTDAEALDYLEKKCNPATACLVRRVRGLEIYPLVKKWEDGEGAPLLKKPADWKIRRALADQIAQTLDLAKHQVAAYVGLGREERQVKIPSYKNGMKDLYWDSACYNSKWRIRIYIDGELTPAQKEKLQALDLAAICAGAEKEEV